MKKTPGIFDPDKDGNGYISLQEAFDYAMLYNAATLYEKPQIDTTGLISSVEYFL